MDANQVKDGAVDPNGWIDSASQRIYERICDGSSRDPWDIAQIIREEYAASSAKSECAAQESNP